MKERKMSGTPVNANTQSNDHTTPKNPVLSRWDLTGKIVEFLPFQEVAVLEAASKQQRMEIEKFIEKEFANLINPDRMDELCSTFGINKSAIFHDEGNKCPALTKVRFLLQALQSKCGKTQPQIVCSKACFDSLCDKVKARNQAKVMVCLLKRKSDFPTDIHDKIPDHLKNVEDLDTWSTYFLEEENRNTFREWVTQSGITSLNLFGAGLTHLPEEIIQIEGLKQLNLSYNKLTELPESIVQLTALQELNLNGNQLKELPESIVQLKALKELDLSSKHLKRLPHSRSHI